MAASVLRTSVSSARPPSGTRGSFARSSSYGSRGCSGGGAKADAGPSGQPRSRGSSPHSDLGDTRTVKQCRTVISSGTSAPLYAEPDVRTTTSMPSSSCVEVPVTRSTSTPSSPEAERPTSSAVRGCWP